MTTEQKLAKFNDGPWMDEPDHVEFEAHGLPCILHRNGMGAWCGYAAVPPGHPWHGKKYSDRVQVANRAEQPTGHTSPIALLVEALRDDDGQMSLDVLVDVHGGLTYSEACQGSICHKAKPGEPDGVWWFGFDCSHSGDLTPSMVQYGFSLGDIYRNVDYVRAETKKLAEQLARVVP